MNVLEESKELKEQIQTIRKWRSLAIGKMDQLYNVFVRHGIIGVRGHQCRITKTVETPTGRDTTTINDESKDNKTHKNSEDESDDQETQENKQ